MTTNHLINVFNLEKKRTKKKAKNEIYHSHYFNFRKETKANNKQKQY